MMPLTPESTVYCVCGVWHAEHPWVGYATFLGSRRGGWNRVRHANGSIDNYQGIEYHSERAEAIHQAIRSFAVYLSRSHDIEKAIKEGAIIKWFKRREDALDKLGEIVSLLEHDTSFAIATAQSSARSG